MIEIKSLTKTFGSVEAVKNISITVPKGEILVFLARMGLVKPQPLECWPLCETNIGHRHPMVTTSKRT